MLWSTLDLENQSWTHSQIIWLTSWTLGPCQSFSWTGFTSSLLLWVSRWTMEMASLNTLVVIFTILQSWKMNRLSWSVRLEIAESSWDQWRLMTLTTLTFTRLKKVTDVERSFILRETCPASSLQRSKSLFLIKGWFVISGYQHNQTTLSGKDLFLLLKELTATLVLWHSSMVSTPHFSKIWWGTQEHKSQSWRKDWWRSNMIGLCWLIESDCSISSIRSLIKEWMILWRFLISSRTLHLMLLS